MAKAKPRAGELTTANYGWVKPTVGASDDAWGGFINADLDGIDSTVKSVSNAIPAASSTPPLMDGTAAAGTGTTFARGDHVHPTDTSRYAASNPSGYQTAAQVTAALPVASSTTPVMDGTAAVGTGTTWARADHVHPTDTSRAPATGGSYLPLQGVTNGTDAPLGQIGEVISSNVTTGVTLTNNVTANVTSILLTAGDWDVSGEVWVGVGTGGATLLSAGINFTNGVLPAASSPSSSRAYLQAALPASSTQILVLRPCRVNLSGSATYYLMIYALFPSGTTTGTGNIWARRAR